jgi:hypothetical protein
MEPPLISRNARAAPNPNEALPLEEDDPSCSLMIMKRGRSLDEVCTIKKNNVFLNTEIPLSPQ